MIADKIIRLITNELKDHDAFRLVLQIEDKGVTTETDVCSTNYIDLQHTEHRVYH